METRPNDAQWTTSKVLESSSPPLIRIPQLGIRKNQKSPCADAVRKQIGTPRNTSRVQSEGESEDEVFPPGRQEEILVPMREPQGRIFQPGPYAPASKEPPPRSGMRSMLSDDPSLVTIQVALPLPQGTEMLRRKGPRRKGVEAVKWSLNNGYAGI